MGLTFPTEKYEVRVLEYQGRSIRFRAYEGIPYVECPEVPDWQVFNIYVPEQYYENTENGRYTLKTAPIFMPNTAGGYMPGKAAVPEVWENGEANSVVKALAHGYVVAAPGIRGRGMVNARGENVGVAPAAICDYKAAVRYLRHNKDVIPGNTERIISNGTSAGGAMSALLGTTGNHPDYEPYLNEMGAAKERDDIFYASCYCPIINLEHADMAYEWEFKGRNDCYQGKYLPPEHAGEEGKWVQVVKHLSEEQIQMSKELAAAFPAYVKSLGLKGKDGKSLEVTEEGGSLQKLLCSYVLKSAEAAQALGEDLTPYKWLLVENKEIIAMDYKAYIKFRTRMKDTPAFDKVGTPEPELFGSKTQEWRHFTEYAYEKDEANRAIGIKRAEAEQVKLMNPMSYVEDAAAVKAKYIRIRHGAIDRDTSLYIPLMYAVKLQNAKVPSDLAFPWGKWHCGDYDLEAVFAQVDEMLQ